MCSSNLRSPGLLSSSLVSYSGVGPEESPAELSRLPVMCGRIALYTEPERMARILDADMAEPEFDNWRPSWNVGPTRPILGVATDGDRRQLHPYRWGLRPGWQQDLSKPQPFNARAETVARSGMFSTAFKHQRVLVPVDGFYEWHPKGHQGAQPYFFRRTDEDLLILAGLSAYWRSADGDEEMHSVTVVTTTAGPDMEAIHNREPVTLERDTWEHWLDPTVTDRDELESLLHPTTEGTLTQSAVNRDVGNIRNDGPGLIETAL